MSFLGNTKDWFVGLFGYLRARPDEVVKAGVRQGVYTLNQMLYDGTIYNTRANAGALEDVLKTFIGPAYCDVNRNKIQPIIMPFKECVEAYQYVLPGTWGDGVEIAEEIDGRPVDARILAPLVRIWRDSRLDTEKATIIRRTANFGTSGIRIKARAADGDKPARVSLRSDHPERLFNFEEDDEGNVTAVCLKYQETVNVNTGQSRLSEPDWQTVDVIEEITKNEFSLRYDDKEQYEDDQRVNNLGFTPYVIARHRENGQKYGDWAYKGSEPLVHRVNWRVTRQDRSIDRNQFANWVIVAGGDPPTSIDMGDGSMAQYIRAQKDTPNPMVEAIVPKIDHASIQAFWMEALEQVYKRQPELLLNNVKLLANTSGEALDRILKPTEKVLGDARPGYHHAFTRALQMALSAGVQVGAWDIGTGNGEGAADAAYRQGIEDFAFKPQPLLPPTVDQILREAQASNAEAKAKLQEGQMAMAINLPLTEVWKRAGYTDAEIVQLSAAKRKSDFLDDEDADTDAK